MSLQSSAEGKFVTSSSFADQLAASFPPAISMPYELRLALNWLEEVGAIIDLPHGRFATLYPSNANVPQDRQSGAGFFIFNSPEAFWPAAPSDAYDRLSLFIQTGDDCSRAGFWLDNDGLQKVVHMHSLGTWTGVVADNILDFLRFMAIGYREPSDDVVHALTFWEAHLEYLGLAPDDPKSQDAASISKAPVPPAAFQAFLAEHFGVTIPERGCEVIASPLGATDELPCDFTRWGWPNHFPDQDT